MDFASHIQQVGNNSNDDDEIATSFFFSLTYEHTNSDYWKPVHPIITVNFYYIVDKIKVHQNRVLAR